MPLAPVPAQPLEDASPTPIEDAQPSVEPQATTPAPEGQAGLQVAYRSRPMSDLSADQLFADGLRSYWSSKFENAAYKFSQAAKKDGENAMYLYMQALAERRDGEPEDAEATLAAAVQLDTTHPCGNWSRIMQRIQGGDRVWLEAGRKEARITRAALAQ